MNVLAAFAPVNLDRPTTETVRICKCSDTCTKATNRIFAQGHDARMVSLLVAEVVTEAITVTAGVEAIRKTGATEALVTKFLAAVQNVVTRAQAKADRKVARKAQAEVVTQADVVVRAKVGRWTYDGVVVSGEFCYINKSGEDKATTKFQLV